MPERRNARRSTALHRANHPSQSPGSAPANGFTSADSADASFINLSLSRLRIRSNVVCELSSTLRFALYLSYDRTRRRWIRKLCEHYWRYAAFFVSIQFLRNGQCHPNATPGLLRILCVTEPSRIAANHCRRWESNPQGGPRGQTEFQFKLELGLTPRVHGLTPRVHGLTPRVQGLTPRVHGLTPRVHWQSDVQ